jgi:hypothetical protein
MDGLRTQKSAAFIIARSSFQTAMAYKDWEAVFLPESFMVILMFSGQMSKNWRYGTVALKTIHSY